MVGFLSLPLHRPSKPIRCPSYSSLRLGWRGCMRHDLHVYCIACALRAAVPSSPMWIQTVRRLQGGTCHLYAVRLLLVREDRCENARGSATTNQQLVHCWWSSQRGIPSTIGIVDSRSLCLHAVRVNDQRSGQLYIGGECTITRRIRCLCATAASLWCSLLCASRLSRLSRYGIHSCLGLSLHWRSGSDLHLQVSDA
jgi:hypothetical protein